jgi:hypothetical protein
MTRALTVACIAVMAGISPLSAQNARVISGDIHWVRGTVSAWSPTTLSVTAGDRCLVLKMDASTVIVGGLTLLGACRQLHWP